MCPEYENERTDRRNQAGEQEESILHGLECQVKNSILGKASWFDYIMVMEVEKIIDLKDIYEQK